MSDKDKWLGIVESVAGMNIGGRQKGPSRSRRRNQALLGVVGSLWKNYEIDQLNQKVDTDNIQNMFETARAHKDLIRAKKSNEQSQYLMELAGRDIDYSNLEALKSSPLSEKAWRQAINSNEQLREISDLNPEEQLLKSPASFKRNLKRLEQTGLDNKSIQNLSSAVTNLYDSQMKNYQNLLLQGKSVAVDEITPFLKQAQQMKIKFDGSESSLLDILSGRARRNITRQDQTFDQFRSEFITQPQLEAKRTIAKLKQVDPNNVQQAQEILSGQNKDVFYLGLPAQTVTLLQAQPNSEKVWNQLNEIITKGGTNLTQEDVTSAANNLISGFLSPNLTDTQYAYSKIITGMRNAKVPEKNIELIQEDLLRFTALPTGAELQNRYLNIQEYQDWQSSMKEIVKNTRANVEKNIKNPRERKTRLEELRILEQQLTFDVKKAGTDYGALGNTVRQYSLDAAGTGTPENLIQSLNDKYNPDSEIINVGGFLEAIANSEENQDIVQQDLQDFSSLVQDSKNQAIFSSYNIDILNRGMDQFNASDRTLAGMDVVNSLSLNNDYVETRKILLKESGMASEQLAQFESYIKLQVDLLSSETLNNNRLGTRYISEENQMAFTLDYLNKNFTVIDDVVSIPTNDTTIANEFKQFIKNIDYTTIGNLSVNKKTKETKLTDDAISLITTNKNDPNKLTSSLNTIINSSEDPLVQRKIIQNISLVLQKLEMGDIDDLYDIDGNNLVLKSNFENPEVQQPTITKQEINDWKNFTPHRRAMSDEKVEEILIQNQTPWFNAEAWAKQNEQRKIEKKEAQKRALEALQKSLDEN